MQLDLARREGESCDCGAMAASTGDALDDYSLPDDVETDMVVACADGELRVLSHVLLAASPVVRTSVHTDWWLEPILISKS